MMLSLIFDPGFLSGDDLAASFPPFFGEECDFFVEKDFFGVLPTCLSLPSDDARDLFGGDDASCLSAMVCFLLTLEVIDLSDGVGDESIPSPAHPRCSVAY